MKIPKNPKRFPWNPGIKNIGKSRDPGIWQNPVPPDGVPENPGIEILDPVRACSPAHWFDLLKSCSKEIPPFSTILLLSSYPDCFLSFSFSSPAPLQVYVEQKGGHHSLLSWTSISFGKTSSFVFDLLHRILISWSEHPHLLTFVTSCQILQLLIWLFSTCSSHRNLTFSSSHCSYSNVFSNFFKFFKFRFFLILKK